MKAQEIMIAYKALQIKARRLSSRYKEVKTERDGLRDFVLRVSRGEVDNPEKEARKVLRDTF